MSRFGVDRQAIDDLLTTSADLREAIWLLIERRERMRDQESIRLDAESGQLLDKIDTIDRDKLVEELRCFRDVLAPHRQLVEKQLRGMTSSTSWASCFRSISHAQSRRGGCGICGSSNWWRPISLLKTHC